MKRSSFSYAAILLLLSTPLFAQKAPDYSECRLDSIFPAGGQRGQQVTVEFLGVKEGLTGPLDVLIDGPPGITVRDVKFVRGNQAQATLVIAPDARPGRRSIRVLGERCGLTNMAYFVVGSLPEHVEKEPNNEPGKSEEVSLPLVVNGRVNPTLDIDCYRFRARAGQRIAAAVLAHAFDYHREFGRNAGFVDASLEVLDERGRVLAEAHDTLGLDPLLEFTAPAEGTYTARVQLNGWQGYPHAVYRLTMGEIPLITSVFPPGGQRGTTLDVIFGGPNVPTEKQSLTLASQTDLPLEYVSLDGPTAGDSDLPFVYGDFTERVEQEPNQQQGQATPLELPMTVNARFDAAGDVDWYRLRLEAKQQIWLQTIAQRHLRSPVDTRIEVFDAAATPLANNDDASEHDGESPHDFRTFDSKLLFTAKKAGEYFAAVSEQSGSFGPRAVYRLTAAPAEPDFQLYQWPDAVPIWGPGTTAAFLVKVERFAGLNSDVELTVEGLPEGWTGSTAYSLGNTSKRPVPSHGLRAFLTITAPADAAIGAHASFRVVGRAVHEGGTIERVAQPLTFYHSGDRGFYRVTPVSRAAVARPQGPWLSTTVTEITLKRGGTATLPVTVHEAGDLQELATVVNLATNAVRCNFGPPQTLKIAGGQVAVPIKVTGDFPLGVHGITVARGWGSDIRSGMPGPCTPLVRLIVTE